MPDVVSLDRSVISWLLGAAGAFILFLLGLGVADVRSQMKKVSTLCLTVSRLEAKIEAMEQRMDRDLEPSR